MTATADALLAEATRIADHLLDLQTRVNQQIDATLAELLPGVVAQLGTGGVDDVDDIHGSDGLALASVPVGEYTRGLLVTHDEPESGPGVDDEQGPTNFSYVDVGDVLDALGLRGR